MWGVCASSPLPAVQPGDLFLQPGRGESAMRLRALLSSLSRPLGAAPAAAASRLAGRFSSPPARGPGGRRRPLHLDVARAARRARARAGRGGRPVDVQHNDDDGSW